MVETPQSGGLYFIDAIRAWAILMMLQGHFVVALLADIYRDKDNLFFSIWTYFSGVTAPVFFTVSGFIFVFLLVKKYEQGFSNPRVKKGFMRGIQLITIGYLLQIRFIRLFNGTINDSYNIVHVLQCIGLSLILIVVLYLISFKFKKQVFSVLLLLITILLFMFKVEYEVWNYSFLPEHFSNYFTKINGSVFTIVPWFGFTSFGGFLAVLFTRYSTRYKFYRNAIIIMVIMGYVLLNNSYEVIKGLKDITGLEIFNIALESSYLFNRLGVVLFVFAFFMLFRECLNHKVILRIGQLTLPIYIVHAMILYNSITGYGLSRFYYHSLPPELVISGAILFVFGISAVVIIVDGKLKS